MTPAASHRKAEVSRQTNETQVSVAINIDGTGSHDIATGIGFLDHMLEQLARHALFDLTVRARGDLHIDQHHTVEDVGITIGQALNQAMGTRAGIARYASIALPMDECMTRVAVDISGRAFLVWQVTFPTPKVGELDTELVREWFQAFTQNAGITAHVDNIYGVNSHHIAETCFKGLARALRAALALDPREAGQVPSTKGTLGAGQ